jgi:hypothetical protein
LGAGTTGSISGNITFSAGGQRLNANDANSITFNSGSIFTAATGFTGNAFTNAGTANVVIFANGSTYVHNDGANPFGLTQPASKVVFQTGSLFKFQQNAAPAFNGRVYANFEINFASFSQSVTGGSGTTMDNLTITLGSLNLNTTELNAVTIKGNISVASGQTLVFNPAAGTNNLTFNGTNAQTVSNSGTLTFAATESVIVDNSNGVTFNNTQTVSGALTINSGALLSTSAALTISLTKTFNGSFQLNQGGSITSAPTYGSASTLIYAGTTQTASTTEFPASGVANLAISSGTVTLSAATNRSISGDLTLANLASLADNGKHINCFRKYLRNRFSFRCWRNSDEWKW